MNIVEEIEKYAHISDHSFCRKDVLVYLNATVAPVSKGSLDVAFSRLVSSGRLVKVGYGRYLSAEHLKPKFLYRLTPEEQSLAGKIKQKFPFARFCIWRPAALTPFMQHVPVVQAVFVDVERMVMEPMLSFLQGLNLACPILLNPSEQECDRYLTNEPILVIRPLVCEAPIDNLNGICVPTLEKMLVDATRDKELLFAQGAEIYHIFANAFERNDMNKSRLLRYASRRNRRIMIEKILQQI